MAAAGNGAWSGEPGGRRDVVIVHIDPLRRNLAPVALVEIFDRSNEIGFNASSIRGRRDHALTRVRNPG